MTIPKIIEECRKSIKVTPEKLKSMNLKVPIEKLKSAVEHHEKLRYNKKEDVFELRPKYEITLSMLRKVIIKVNYGNY